MSINRFRNLAYNPIVQLGLGGLLGGLSGQAPSQAFGQTGNQFMQLGRQLEQQEALKVLSQMPELTTLQKQLLPIAPGEVVKSLLTEPEIEKQTRVLSDEEVKKQFPKLPAGTIVQQKPSGEFTFKEPPAGIVKASNHLGDGRRSFVFARFVGPRLSQELRRTNRLVHIKVTHSQLARYLHLGQQHQRTARGQPPYCQVV